jgi:hypothetical protein
MPARTTLKKQLCYANSNGWLSRICSSATLKSYHRVDASCAVDAEELHSTLYLTMHVCIQTLQKEQIYFQQWNGHLKSINLSIYHLRSGVLQWIRRIKLTL